MRFLNNPTGFDLKSGFNLTHPCVCQLAEDPNTQLLLQSSARGPMRGFRQRMPSSELFGNFGAGLVGIGRNWIFPWWRKSL